MNEESAIVEEVRRRATEISKRFGDDLYEYGRHLRGLEKKHEPRVVSQITVVADSRKSYSPKGHDD